MAGRAGRRTALPDWLKAVEKEKGYSWAIKAWRRAAAVEGAWFDAAKADAVIELWPKVFRLTVDRFAGVPFRLNTWQEIIVRLMVGWKVPVEIVDPVTHETKSEHVRLIRTLRLWVPRKNGKSEYLAALALLFFAIDAVVRGEGYVFGRHEDQGRIVLDRMKAMVSYNDELAAAMQANRNSIYLKTAASLFSLLTGAEEGKHGKSPTVIVGDEMHEWKSRKIENDLRQGTGGRLQPVELYASTAGLKTNLTGVELWQESLEVLDGTVEDPTTLVVVFAADPEDDWTDEAVWAKANPSLGLSPTKQHLRREVAMAKGNPRAEVQFKCYHLNIWADAEVRWLNMKKWDACASGKAAWKTLAERLAGRPCYGGIDVSSTRDITARVLLFPPFEDDRRWHLLPRFWVPADTLAERVKVDRVPYDRFLAQGAIETTVGDFVDQNAVLNDMVEVHSRFDIRGWGYDPWNASKLAADAQAEGIEPEMLMVVRQGVQSMGEATKQFERLVYAGQLDHGAHPVLRWMAQNTVVRFDENLNYMPAKKRSAEKIDGIVASVTALAVQMFEEEEGPSVYEDRGLVEIEL